jgi:hypothetical protein
MSPAVEVKVLLITLERSATVPVSFGNVIVLSAVGSVTVNVVSNASFVDPSKARPVDPIVLFVNTVALEDVA